MPDKIKQQKIYTQSDDDADRRIDKPVDRETERTFIHVIDRHR